MKKNNYGFIPDELAPDHYIFGSNQLGFEELQENGQWDNYLPDDELQIKYGLETMNCTVYGTLNAIEILLFRLFSLKKNFSERYIGVLAGTTKQGNSPHKVAETIRKFGLIDDNLLPFTNTIDTWEGYYYPNPMSLDYINKGKKWGYEFGHDWVFTGGTIKQKQDLLKSALKSSPIGVSVDAWKKKGEYYIKEKDAIDNHWCTCYGYVEGKYWKIFDHYDNTKKKLAWDYDFGMAKRFTLQLTSNSMNVYKDLWNRLYSFFKEFFIKIINTNFIDQSKKREVINDALLQLNEIKKDMENKGLTNEEKLIILTRNSIGEDISPRNIAPQELSCAEGVSELLKRVYDDMNIYVSTRDLFNFLDKSPKFKRVVEPRQGCIVISPRTEYTAGHTGIFVDGDINKGLDIASNDSSSGKLEINYTWDSWIKEFKYKRKLRIYLFELV